MSPAMQNDNRAGRHLPTVRAPGDLQEIILIAATGQHSVLLMENWVPDTSTLIARRIPEILPPMSEAESARTQENYSRARLEEQYRVHGGRPFRAPHHTASGIAVTGSTERAGETALAHNGVLYLHDIPQVARTTLTKLTQVRASDASVHARPGVADVRYPADILIVGRMTACPCGHGQLDCNCSPEALEEFQQRPGEPELSDLFTMLSTPRKPAGRPAGPDPELNTQALRSRLMTARRFAEQTRGQTFPNDKATPEWRGFNEYYAYQPAPATDTMDLSENARIRVLKVGRTVADLAGAAKMLPEHLRTALALTSHLRPAD